MRVLLLGVAFSLIAGAACAEEVSLCALARDPDVYDGQTVTVIASYDPAMGDNGGLQDSECGDAVVQANLTTQPSVDPAFSAAMETALPFMVTATGVFHNNLGEVSTLSLDIETITPN